MVQVYISLLLVGTASRVKPRLSPAGEIMGIVRPDEVTPEELGLMMAGSRREREVKQAEALPAA